MTMRYTRTSSITILLIVQIIYQFFITQEKLVLLVLLGLNEQTNLEHVTQATI